MSRYTMPTTSLSANSADAALDKVLQDRVQRGVQQLPKAAMAAVWKEYLLAQEKAMSPATRKMLAELQAAKAA